MIMSCRICGTDVISGQKCPKCNYVILEIGKLENPGIDQLDYTQLEADTWEYEMTSTSLRIVHCTDHPLINPDIHRTKGAGRIARKRLKEVDLLRQMEDYDRDFIRYGLSPIIERR